MILAGGSGTRIGKAIPKQFLKVGGKPILAYTMDRFQNHPAIDSMVVVCVDGWENEVWEIAHAYGIGKLTVVVAGGSFNHSAHRTAVRDEEKVLIDVKSLYRMDELKASGMRFWRL